MYNERIAIHYAAYRPPIHKVILERVLASSRNRRIGLDIGCGTGRSSHALGKYCPYVVGLDPSWAMLKNAKAHKGVKFVNASGEQVPIADHSVDVATLAGSLNYIDRTKLIGELKRVCRSDAEIVIYDFEIDLSNIEDCLNLEDINYSPEYDHSSNLRGYSEVKAITVIDDVLSLDLSPVEIVHLLLSEARRYEALQAKYPSQDLMSSVKIDIETMSSKSTIKANIYYSLYALQ